MAIISVLYLLQTSSRVFSTASKYYQENIELFFFINIYICKCYLFNISFQKYKRWYLCKLASQNLVLLSQQLLLFEQLIIITTESVTNKFHNILTVIRWFTEGESPIISILTPFWILNRNLEHDRKTYLPTELNMV